jgi:hypothetical protein
MTWLEVGAPLALEPLFELIGEETGNNFVREAEARKEEWQAYTLIEADKYGNRQVVGAFFWLPRSRRAVRICMRPGILSDECVFWEDVHPKAITAHEALWAGGPEDWEKARGMLKRLAQRPAPEDLPEPGGLGLPGVVIVSGGGRNGFKGKIYQWPFTRGAADDELWEKVQNMSLMTIAVTGAYRKAQEALDEALRLASHLRVEIIATQLPRRAREIVPGPWGEEKKSPLHWRPGEPSES